MPLNSERHRAVGNAASGIGVTVAMNDIGLPPSDGSGTAEAGAVAVATGSTMQTSVPLDAVRVLVSRRCKWR